MQNKHPFYNNFLVWKYFAVLNFVIIHTSLSNKPPFSHQKTVQGVMIVEVGN